MHPFGSSFCVGGVWSLSCDAFRPGLASSAARHASVATFRVIDLGGARFVARCRSRCVWAGCVFAGRFGRSSVKRALRVIKILLTVAPGRLRNLKRRLWNAHLETFTGCSRILKRGSRNVMLGSSTVLAFLQQAILKRGRSSEISLVKDSRRPRPLSKL